MTIKKAKTKRKSARDLKSVHILLENSAEGLESIRERCRSYIPIYDNTSEKLLHLPQNFATMLLSGSSEGAVGA